jgi:hypothetical protein
LPRVSERKNKSGIQVTTSPTLNLREGLVSQRTGIINQIRAFMLDRGS